MKTIYYNESSVNVISLRALAWISFPFFTSSWIDMFLPQILAIPAYSFCHFLSQEPFHLKETLTGSLWHTWIANLTTLALQ